MSSFVPCSRSTGAPELVPCGEIIVCPEKHLRIYYIDQDQIRMLEEHYGLKNGRQPGEVLRPLVTAKAKKRKPAWKGRRS